MSDDLEAFVQSVDMSGAPVEIPRDLLPAPAPAPEFRSVRGEAVESELDQAPAPAQIISISEFTEKWAFLHGIMSIPIEMRSLAPCDLEVVALSPAGLKACEAAYRVIEKSPTMARLILSEGSGFFADMTAISWHLMGCYKIVKASFEAGADERSKAKLLSEGNRHET